ncbi:hypothetical protein [Sorangium cellulosum]|uniref:hypothetical protein n=1 Tax=Sorangium cellulosum TaxID=56 RepID=UPI001651B0A2|nr:hypothetical protein [Sorangium cellulosum]
MRAPSTRVATTNHSSGIGSPPWAHRCASIALSIAVLVSAVACEPSGGGGGAGGEGGGAGGEGGGAGGEGGSGAGGEGGSGGAGGEGSGAGGEGGSGGAGGEGGAGGSSTAPTLAWARVYGGPGVDQGHVIASDAEGNFYVTGSFEGTVDFGAGPLTSGGQDDIFLLKLGPSGELLWSKRFGNDHDERGTRLATDGNGNIFLAGVYNANIVTPGESDNVDFGGGPLPGDDPGEYGFLVKLDRDGNHVWSWDSFDFRVTSLAVDATGHVYTVTSSFQYGAYLARKDGATGGQLWGTWIVNGGGWPFTTSLALDSAGNVVFASGTESGPGVCPCQQRFGVGKLTPAGGLLWRRSFSDGEPSPGAATYGAMAHVVAVNTADEIFVAGHSLGNVDFGGGVLPAGDVLVKLDPSGEHVFSRPSHRIFFMVGDRDGNILVDDGHIVNLDPNGTKLWTLPFWVPLSRVSVSPLGTIAATGSTTTALDFGDGPLPFAGALDISVVALNP